ncbi:Drug transporter [Globisporangium polare]
MSCGTKEAIVFTLGLISGTGTTLTGKILYGIDSVGLDGEVKKFEKPIFQTWLMFFAMVFALPIQWGYHWHVERKWRATARNGMKYRYKIPRKMYFLLALPAAFDLLATFLANLGLLYVTVSVFQLMKCTVIIFVALLKVFVLKDRLRGYMWIGIGFNTLAVLMVGATSFADTDEQVNNKDAHPGFGIIMIVLSCGVQAFQYVFEEKLMDEGDSAPPLVVVGMEGVWGLILTTFVVYPIAYMVPGNDFGSNERFDDAYEMLKNSTFLQVIALVYVIVILAYNVFAVSVTYLLNSIWHAILDNFRPITVWGTDLLLFYVFTRQAFGEAWTIWSWLQLAGMVTLLAGTAVYNGTIKLPGFAYLEPIEESLTPIRTTLDLASSSLSHSPLITRNAMKAAEIARRTPNPKDRDRVRREFMTEYQPLVDTEARRRIDPAGHSYGSLDN